MRSPLLLLLGLLTFGRAQNFDVVIYGATPAGIAAAVEASRHKLNVVIVAPEPYLGGMVAGGLGATDVGDKNVIGGIALEFFKRVGVKYGRNDTAVFSFEPHVASTVFTEMLTEANVSLFLNYYLPEDGSAVMMAGKAITKVKVLGANQNQLQLTARVFIDASYEGTLMGMAGVSWTYGREGSKEHNESLAGYLGPGGHDGNGQDFSYHIFPYKSDNKTLIPHVQPPPNEQLGEGDKKVQAYNFRLCATKSANRLKFPMPNNYDPFSFELVDRYIAAFTATNGRPPTFESFFQIQGEQNGKFDWNNAGPLSTDMTGENWDYPTADRAGRAALWQKHRDYQAGFIYFLANNASVPDSIRIAANAWGLCADEFTETGGWPWQLYVRECRRMLGDFIFTQHDAQETITKDDVIGMGSYNIDSHNIQRFPHSDGWVRNEGDMFIGDKKFQIPYSVLRPKQSECTNLLVPVCISATHIGSAPLRLEPQYMIMGHAAGLAAAEAHYYNVSVQNVNVEEMQGKLKNEGVILHL